jgi:DNA-binding beta-propeller fold protein YncE
MGQLAKSTRRDRWVVLAALVAALLLAGVALADPVHDLTFRRVFGEHGTGPQQLYHPRDVEIDKQGRTWVADTQNHRIQVFASDGTFLRTIGEGVGQGEGQLYYPEALALDDPADPGFVYVADTANSRIQVFDASTGASVQTWGKLGEADGDLNNPSGIATDGNYVYVTDSRNHRVEKFTTAGTYVTKWGVAGVGDGAFNVPAGISVAEGFVYVTDEQEGIVQIFNAQGGFISKFGEKGSEPGQLDFPDEISVCGLSIYVAEAGNAQRVSRFVKLDSVEFTGTFTGTAEPGTSFSYPHAVSCVRQSGDEVVAVASTNESRIYKFSEEEVEIKIDPNEKPSALLSNEALRFHISHDGMFRTCRLEKAVAVLVIPDGELIGLQDDYSFRIEGPVPALVRPKKELAYDFHLLPGQLKKAKKAINNNVTLKVRSRFRFDEACAAFAEEKSYKIT